MKGIIINHDSSFIDDLKKLFENCDVIHYKDLEEGIDVLYEYDYVVLSGGPINISGREDLVEEKIFLKKTNKPVIGICLGFEILCVAEGSKLPPLGRLREGFFELNFFGTKGKLYQSHSWLIEDAPSCYEVLEKTGKIIELVVHKEKPFLGIQGHPEKSGKFGVYIRDFFLNNFVKKHK